MSKAARCMGTFLALACLVGVSVGSAQAKGEAGFQTGFDEWKDFTGWTLSGVSVAAGKLVLNPALAVMETDPYPPGAYYGGNYYNGGNFYLGEALGPEMAASFSFKELIASWNAETPLGSWVEVQARAKLGTRWSKWYSLGVWTGNNADAVKRHSVKLQGDADGTVATDTLVISAKKAAVSGYQLKVRLFSADGEAVPSLRYLSAATSTAAPKKVTVSSGNPAYWGAPPLAVPECSQMVYPDGGNVWCSPTSVSMVLGFYGVSGSSCEERVRTAVAGVYDWIYDGHGNWPFNTAYAATYGFQTSVRRLTSLNQVEELVARGIPVVFSFAWGKGDLTGAAVPSSAGHLSVIVGFTASGDPIVNDPAAAADEDVQRTYPRAELEKLWLTNSAGTVYVIEPGE